jgi:hypothetical protein
MPGANGSNGRFAAYTVEGTAPASELARANFVNSLRSSRFESFLSDLLLMDQPHIEVNFKLLFLDLLRYLERGPRNAGPQSEHAAPKVSRLDSVTASSFASPHFWYSPK